MSMQDPIADMLNRIRNAQAMSKVSVEMEPTWGKIRLRAIFRWSLMIAFLYLCRDSCVEI